MVSKLRGRCRYGPFPPDHSPNGFSPNAANGTALGATYRLCRPRWVISADQADSLVRPTTSLVPLCRRGCARSSG